MKYLQMIGYVLIAFATLGCSNNDAFTKTVDTATDTFSSPPVKQVVAQDTPFVPVKPTGNADTITYIRFPEMTLAIDRLVVWDEENKLGKLQADSVSLYTELGETIEGQQIAIITDQLTHVLIEQRYQTSVVISDEGPHCDLTDWKHFYSDWKPLQQTKDGKFISPSYTNRDRIKFPEVSIQELKEKVRKHCGKEWYQLVKNIKSPNEYPADVGISRYFLRVSAKQKGSGKLVRKIIVIEQPMGC